MSIHKYISFFAPTFLFIFSQIKSLNNYLLFPSFLYSNFLSHTKKTISLSFFWNIYIKVSHFPRKPHSFYGFLVVKPSQSEQQCLPQLQENAGNLSHPLQNQNLPINLLLLPPNPKVAASSKNPTASSSWNSG